MKRYNRWLNLITSIVVSVCISLFFVFALLPCYDDVRYYPNPRNPNDYYLVTLNLFNDTRGQTALCLVFMYLFIIFSTASLVIDILHAVGPFKENKAYRILHISLSTVCFGFAIAAIPLLGVSLAGYHRYVYSPIFICLSTICVLCALEASRIVLGAIALRKASNAFVNETPTPKGQKNNSDYAVKKLKDLKDLLSEGIISEEEYNEAKKKYVKDL